MAQLESYKVVTLRKVPSEVSLVWDSVSNFGDGIEIISSLFRNANCLLADPSSSELCSSGAVLRGIPQ